MGYFKTTVRAGATIEVTKSYAKRIGVKIKKDREKPTAEEMEKVNQMNAERTLRLKINANFGVDDPFITLTYRKDERPTPKQATVNNIMGKSQPNKKNVAEIANEVISGKWGNGSERKEKLEAAGYNYAEVQAKVNEMLR